MTRVTKPKTATTKKRKPSAPPKRIVVLVVGDEMDICASAAEAKGFAWGPRFSAGYTVVTYTREKVEHFDGK